MRGACFALSLALLAGACRGPAYRDEGSTELERTFRASERKVKENRILSGLAQMEEALAGYKGVLVLISHDAAFRAALPGRALRLGGGRVRR